MHILDIIVTHYKESDEIVNRFLNSLAAQTFHDLKVTIVDDGLDCPELSFGHFPFEIEHLKKEHKTVSAARNFGLDNTSAKYVMFCDCDDMFDKDNSEGLYRAMSRIVMNDLHVYRSMMYVEAWKNTVGNNALSSLYSNGTDDELVKMPSNINPSTVHCKIYKRKFLLDYDIRFLDDLWMNEDGVFNNLASGICKFQKFPNLDDCERFYIWKYNANSITRQNKLYPILGYDQYLKATSHLYVRLKSLTSDTDHFKLCIMESAFQAYYWLYLYSDRFIGKEGFEKYMEEDMTELKKFLNLFEDSIDLDMCENKEFSAYVSERMNLLNDCDLSKKTEFKTWLKSVMAA